MAIVALFVAAAAVVVYILGHQPSFTLGKSYYAVRVPFASGAAVTAGQGQSVDVAGVQVGEVGKVELKGGQALVTMNLYKQYQPIYSNATVLLRPRTPLKDMYLSLDPGRKAAGAAPVADGGMLSVGNTQPDVNVEEILATLDVDTRNYLLLLLSGGAQLFHDGAASGAQPSPAAVADLRGTFKRFAPLARDTRTFTELLKDRTRNIRRSIHSLAQVTQALGSVDGRLTSLINSSNTNFAAISSQDVNLEQALTLLPGTLQQTTQTLGKVQAFANQSTPALRGLVPVRARVWTRAGRCAAPLPRHDPGDSRPAPAVLGRGAASGQDPQPRVGETAPSDPRVEPLHRRAQLPVQHPGLPAGRLQAGLPVLGLVAQPQRPVTYESPGRPWPGGTRPVHGDVHSAPAVRGRAGERKPGIEAAAGAAQRTGLEQDRRGLLPDREHSVNKQAPSTTTDSDHGRVHGVLHRAAVVPVDLLRRGPPAWSAGLPAQGRVQPGRAVGPAVGRAHLGRERGEGALGVT